MRIIACAVLSSCLLLGLQGCTDKKQPEREFDAAPEAPTIDGGVTPTAPTPSAEMVTGGGTLRGGSVDMQIELGHPTSQEPTSGGNTTVEGNSAVKR